MYYPRYAAWGLGSLKRTKSGYCSTCSIFYHERAGVAVNSLTLEPGSLSSNTSSFLFELGNLEKPASPLAHWHSTPWCEGYQVHVYEALGALLDSFKIQRMLSI